MFQMKEKIYEFICNSPGCTSKVICDGVSLDGKKGGVHLLELEKDGLITRDDSDPDNIIFHPTHFAKLALEVIRE